MEGDKERERETERDIACLDVVRFHGRWSRRAAHFAFAALAIPHGAAGAGPRQALQNKNKQNKTNNKQQQQ